MMVLEEELYYLLTVLHVIQTEENGKLRTKIYCVNRIGNVYSDKVIFQFEIPGKLQKSDVSLESYTLLNQELKVSAQKSGDLEFKLVNLRS